MAISLSARANPRTPVAGPSSTETCNLSVSARGISGADVTMLNAGHQLSYGDAPPTTIDDASNTMVARGGLLGYYDSVSFATGNPWGFTATKAYVNPVGAAAGHHMYLSLYDTTAGASAPVIATVDLGVVN